MVPASRYSVITIRQIIQIHSDLIEFVIDKELLVLNKKADQGRRVFRKTEIAPVDQMDIVRGFKDIFPEFTLKDTGIR